MMISDWPQTYVSSSPNRRPTFDATAAAGEVVSAIRSSVTMVSPMSSRPRPTCPCQSRQRIRSIVSERRLPASHAAQLIPLPIRLRGHAAENDLLAVIVADLSKHHLERASPITSDRPHMAAVDGERDGLCFGRWRARLARHRQLLQASAHPQGSPTARLHRRNVADWQEVRQQCAGPAIWQQRPHLCDDTFVFGGASVGHNLGDGSESMPAGHRTPAGRKPRGANLHRAKQRGQPAAHYCATIWVRKSDNLGEKL
jgi:hypothetical protein